MNNSIPSKEINSDYTEKIRYWDKHPGKFRTIIIIAGAILLAVLIINTYRNATTIFSGTHYMRLPSPYYITKQIVLNKTNGIPRNADTIQTGSFLLSINNKILNNESDLKEILGNIPADSSIQITLFNKKETKYLLDLEIKKKFFELSDTFTVKKSFFTDDLLKYISGGSFIAFIEKGGATDRAGMKAGDVLLSIRDVEPTFYKYDQGEYLTNEFLKHLRSQKRGEPVPFKVLRDNEIMTLDVRLATFGIQLIIVMVLFCGLAFFSLGAFYALKRPKLIAARITGVAFILLGFQIALSISNYPSNYDLYSYIWTLLINITIFIALPVIFHSLDYFPKEIPELTGKKRNILIPYIIGVVTILIFSLWYFINNDSIYGTLFTLLLLANVLYYFINKRFFYSKYIKREYKNISRLISYSWLIVMVIAFLGPVLNILGAGKLPGIFRYNFLTLLIIPLVYLYVTWRYRLLDIDFKIRRNVQYVLFSVFWKIFLLASFVFLIWLYSGMQINFPELRISGSNIIELTSGSENSETNIFYNKIFFVICSFLTALIFIRAGKKVNNFLDRKFYREKFDYKSVQNELIKPLEKKFTIEEIASIIVEKVSSLVHLKKTGVLLFKENLKTTESKIYCFESKKCEHFTMTVPNSLIKSVIHFNGPFAVDYLSEEIRNHLIKNGFQHIIPVKTKEKFLGAMLIGEKLSETALKNEDIEFLSSIIASTSVAIENVFLYEELAVKERIKKELEIAHRIQVASLPQAVPVISGLDICATSIPALEVGGDFYDFLNGKSENLTVVMGDVSGKGTSAALYMSKIQGIFQTLHEFDLSPSKLLRSANRLLYRHIDSKSYITAIGANFDTKNKAMTFSRAGHLPLFYFNKDKNEISRIMPKGIGLGLSTDDIFTYSLEEITINYSPGDIFFFISDGITESLNASRSQYGEDRLLEIIKDNCLEDSKSLCCKIIDSVKNFSLDAEQFDDITLIVIKAN